MVINKSWCKIVFLFSYICNIFFWNSIRIPRINASSSNKIYMYFIAGINTKQFENILEEKYFAPLRILKLFINFFVNPFVDVAFTFFDSWFNSFSISTCFALFEVPFWFIFFSLSSKSVLLTKLAIFLLMKLVISFLIAKFDCTNLAEKTANFLILF